MKCCVLGTGTWGSALAQVLCDNGHQVVAYGIEESEVNDINLNHKNTRYFGDDVIFSDAFKATLSLEEAMKDAEVYVLAVPTFAIRGLLNKMKPLIQGKPYFVGHSRVRNNRGGAKHLLRKGRIGAYTKHTPKPIKAPSWCTRKKH